MGRTLWWTVAAINLLSVLLIMAATPVSAQTCTAPPQDAAANRSWPGQQEVAVYIDTGFSAGERQEIENTISQFNGIGGVIFTFSTSSQLIGGIRVWNIRDQSPQNEGEFARTTFYATESSFYRADTYIREEVTAAFGTGLQRALAHEAGHSFGLLDCHNCDGSIMEVPPAGTAYTEFDFGATGPTGCDQEEMEDYMASNHPPEGDGGEQNNRGQCEEDMSDLANPDGCYSPIIITEQGQRIDLTNAMGGVNFDLDGDGLPERLAWIRAGSTAAFLALDRNRNGVIDDGRELFGNFTPQPVSSSPNGFLALSLLDSAAEGGNQDGWISSADARFSDLLLWTDLNHDGVSQTSELHGAGEMGMLAMGLSYRESRRRDRHGNWFRYVGTAYHDGAQGRIMRTFMIDVFLATQNSPPFGE